MMNKVFIVMRLFEGEIEGARTVTGKMITDEFIEPIQAFSNKETAAYFINNIEDDDSMTVEYYIREMNVY